MERFSAVKFAMGYEKKYELSSDTIKISKSLKKVQNIGLGSLKGERDSAIARPTLILFQTSEQ